MARTTSGVLYLTKREREALRSAVYHLKANQSWGEGGSLIDDEGKWDKKEDKKVTLALETLEFILRVTS